MSYTKQFRECNVIDWSFIYVNNIFLYYNYEENKELSNQADIQTKITIGDREKYTIKHYYCHLKYIWHLFYSHFNILTVNIRFKYVVGGTPYMSLLKPIRNHNYCYWWTCIIQFCIFLFLWKLDINFSNLLLIQVSFTKLPKTNAIGNTVIPSFDKTDIPN